MAEGVTRSNGKCDYPVCEGGHHKYEDCRTEALASAMDWADKVTGNVEWSVYAELHLFRESAQIDRKDSGMAFDVYFPAGTHYVVKHDDRGFVCSAVYPSAVEAENAFGEIDRAYGAWLDAED